jgi:hypothetical protein
MWAGKASNYNGWHGKASNYMDKWMDGWMDGVLLLLRSSDYRAHRALRMAKARSLLAAWVRSS